MNKIINITEISNRYKYKVKVVSYKRETINGEKYYERAIIIIEESSSKKTLVHPFSQYILAKYRNKRIKTQVDYASKIVRFLNYYKENNRKRTMKDIGKDDIRDFLQYISIGVSRETVAYYRRVIVNFLIYLSKKDFLHNITINDFYMKEIITQGISKRYMDIDIGDIDLPANVLKDRNTHSMSYNLQAMFLDVAYEEVNVIAFGIALQLFGGLRTGEVINLKYSSITTIGRYGRYGLLLKIRDNNLRSDLMKNDAKGHVKKKREQQVFSPFQIIEKIFKLHTLKYKDLSGSGAVFVDTNGNPMSYGSYMYYFRKLKTIFIKRLQQSEDPKIKAQGLVLLSKRWGSHVGRGNFTNNMVNIVNSPSQLQYLRGDSSIESAAAYLDDSMELARRMEENSEEVFVQLVNKLRDKR